MKKIILLAASVFFIFNSHSQNIIPNSGFENWVPNPGYEDPQGWGTLNILSQLGNPVAVFKDSINPYAGNYAMKITTVVLTANPDTTLLPDTFGTAFTGNVSFSGFVLGYPYTLKPSVLNFYYKYNPSGMDSAYCAVQLFKWDSINKKQDTLAKGFFKTSAITNSYTMAMVPLNYNPAFLSLTPDTAMITFSASNDYVPIPGSAFFVDELSFTGGNTGIDLSPATEETVLVYPNPAKNDCHFILGNSAKGNILIYDELGKFVSEFKAENNIATIDVRFLKNGRYFFLVQAKNKAIINKGIINIMH